MIRERVGQLTFAGAAALALLVYGLTVPEGLPWNASTHLALAYLGGIARLPTMPHPIWGFYVKVFGGPIALSVTLTALAAGLLGSLVNRHLGWRFALGAAIVWIFLPGVWNRAVTGERGVCLAAMAVVAAWVANAIALRTFRKARAARKTDVTSASLVGVVRETKRGRVNRAAGWFVLGAAGSFAIVSASLHDYRLGEAASAYARGIVEEAGDRIVLLNGLCDDQIEREIGAGSRRTTRSPAAIAFRNTEANRSNIVAWVKREWPSETNLWLEAEIGPASFAEAVVKAHPERFYSMMGQSTTPENWESRWGAMKPYLASSDPFIPTMRRMFAYEGNVLGNRMLESQTGEKQAWNLYCRIFTEIHPKNPAACVNLNEMLRRGYKTDEATRQRIESAQSDYAKIMKDRQKAKRVAEWISHFGPVIRDQKAYEELRERVRSRMEELEKKGDRAAMIPDFKTLQEWNTDMMEALNAREIDNAAHIARAILARRPWRGFVPANMVLGEAMSLKGDWVAAEAFLRVAAEATGAAAPPPPVLNDYAEALRRLGRLDEAERYARRAVAESDEKTGWLYRLTLAQVLEGSKAEGASEEIRLLLRSVLKCAPPEMREKIRNGHGDWL